MKKAEWKIEKNIDDNVYENAKDKRVWLKRERKLSARQREVTEP